MSPCRRAWCMVAEEAVYRSSLYVACLSVWPRLPASCARAVYRTARHFERYYGWRDHDSILVARMTQKIELTHTLFATTLREEADVRASLGSVSRAAELRAMADALQSRGDALEAARAESPSPVPEQTPE